MSILNGTFRGMGAALATVALLGAGCIDFAGGGAARWTSVGFDVPAGWETRLWTADERAHMTIPAGALAEDTTITITEVPLPEAAGDQQAVAPAFDFGPDGLRFAEPVLVQLRPGRLPAGRSLSELSLYSLSDGRIEELSGVRVDEAEGTIRGYTTHFSIFYAAFSGPAGGAAGPGGRGISIGGPNLSPLFGSSDRSVDPPEVDLWIGDGGTISTNPYTGPFADELVIQIDTGSPVAGQTFYIEGWTVSPVDPAGTTGPTGDRISTSGFWHDYFSRAIVGPLRDLRTDDQGRLTLVIRGADILREIGRAPAGYSEGRMRLRVLSPDAPDAVDIYLGITTAP